MSINPPQYRVRDPSPSAAKVVSNFNLRDLFHAAIYIGIALPVGYYGGKPIRIPTMKMAGVIGLAAGFCHAYQDSTLRYMGRKPWE